jgi:hypothetical protein
MRIPRIAIAVLALSVLISGSSCAAKTTTDGSAADGTSAAIETTVANATTAAATDTTEKTTLPLQEESTAATSDTFKASGAPEITPPAERVYPITSEDAIAIFDALGLPSTDISKKDDFIDKEITAFDSAKKYVCVYFSFTKDSYARDYLKLMQDTFTSNEDIGTLKGTAQITEEDGYSKLLVKGAYENNAHIYVVGICVDNVVVLGYTISDEESDMQFIDSCFIGLGYMKSSDSV